MLYYGIADYEDILLHLENDNCITATKIRTSNFVLDIDVRK
jgi:hypothetical protein